VFLAGRRDFADGGGYNSRGAFFINGAPVVMGATAAEDWTDWKVVHIERGPFVHETLADRYRWKDGGTMATSFRGILGLIAILALARPLLAGPEAVVEPQRLVVTGRDYRVTFHRYRCEPRLELRDGQGRWRAVTKRTTVPEFAVIDAAGSHSSANAPARIRHEKVGDALVVGLTTILPTAPPTIARAHFLCREEGMLICFAPEVRSKETGGSWALPRLALDPTVFDAYAYWRGPDELRSGRIAALGAPTVYAGVSPWGDEGDTAPRLSPRHPAVIARSESAGLALGAVFLDYESRWRLSHSFLQEHTPAWLFFCPAIAGRDVSSKDAWSWLAPMPVDPGAAAAQVERLADEGRKLVTQFQPIAPEPESYWTQAQPDFPVALRRAQPVEDIGQAVVYTINETILSEDGIDLARKAGSDVLIRAWFKWRMAPDVGRLGVTLPEFEAYSVAILHYDQLPELKPSGRRTVPTWRWARPARSEFIVREGSLVSDQWALSGMLQGNLHGHLRNPPTFVVNMPQGGSLKVHVRGVATLGARLQWQVDGRVVKTIDLPDRDGKNEAMAREYDETYELAIPLGRHRLTLDNVGGDRACVGWYALVGAGSGPTASANRRGTLPPRRRRTGSSI
jgi:hypothetical protein